MPRYRCRSCGRRFSRQSFRADWRQKKPYLNATLLHLMVSCVGQRQAARALRVARRTIERRTRWMAVHARAFHEQRLDGARLEGPFQLDELESFEANRYQPVTVPVLIDRRTLFIVATAVGPLRRKGRMTSLQRRRREEHEAVHGRRPTHSARAVRSVLEHLRPLTARHQVALETDRKPLYGYLGSRVFGSRLRWRTHSASARRDRANPLFPINHTNARLRHFLARLRRRTWCVSKRRGALQGHLHVAALWSNWCRGITNRTTITPAQALGLAPRPYRAEELLAWRLVWHARSSVPAPI
ncbi:MAG TPA: hypothetical protein VFB49_10085 [Patescibacteria group bacterium]|nr:hypothetical protein [Patescibacteria group bacterium]